MSRTNRQITLVARPSGYPKLSDFKLLTPPVPTPQEGQILVQTLYLSVDPYMRGRMNAGRSYAPGVQIDAVMTGGIVGKVIDSKNADFQEGDIVQGDLGWQEFAMSDGNNLRKIDPDLAPISTALGILGMPGFEISSVPGTKSAFEPLVWCYGASTEALTEHPIASLDIPLRF